MSTTLRPDEVVTDRPFTAPSHGEEDRAILDRMLTRLRRHMAEVVVPSGDVRRDDRFTDPADGSQHSLIVADVARATAHRSLVVVGFFGQARMDVDHAPIVDLEQAIMADMGTEPGLVVYYNVHWPAEGWGNLVLFDDWTAKDRWGRDDPRHTEAVRRSPAHYHSIRLHHGIIDDGLPGEGTVRLVRTRYLDYRDRPAWRAVRELA
jgi:hypothetical protein